MYVVWLQLSIKSHFWDHGFPKWCLGNHQQLCRRLLCPIVFLFAVSVTSIRCYLLMIIGTDSFFTAKCLNHFPNLVVHRTTCSTLVLTHYHISELSPQVSACICMIIIYQLSIALTVQHPWFFHLLLALDNDGWLNLIKTKTNFHDVTAIGNGLKFKCFWVLVFVKHYKMKRRQHYYRFQLI